LRERRKDIALLVNHFTGSLNTKYKKGIVGIEKELLNVFQTMHWEGNVRSLKNIIENLYISSKSPVLKSSDFNWGFSETQETYAGEMANDPSTDSQPSSLNETLQQAEKNKILHALSKHGWRKDKASHDLGISRSTLYRRMEELEIR
jgi:DNA-binding NtrC family response regulator